MDYLDKRDNADIIEHIRRRYFLKGTAFVFLAAVMLVFFYVYAYDYFADRLGAVNGVLAILLGVAIPFFLLKLHKDVLDKSWEGEIVARRSHLVRSRSENVGVNKRGTVVRGMIMLEYLTLTVDTGKSVVIVDRPADELARFNIGDRLRHIKGTKYLQACRHDSTNRDCVMCGCIVRESGNECPHCNISLVKFDLPGEEIPPKTEVKN